MVVRAASMVRTEWRPEPMRAEAADPASDSAVVTSAVAPGRAAALSIPPPPAIEAPAWPSDRPGFLAGGPADAGRLAAAYYGDARLAPLLIEAPGGFTVRPGALIALHRAAYHASVAEAAAWGAHRVADAQLDRAEMQAALLDAMRGLPHPDAQDALLTEIGSGGGRFRDEVPTELGASTGRFTDEVQAEIAASTDRSADEVLASLAGPQGPRTADILAERLTAEARVGPPSRATVGLATERLLTWMGGGADESAQAAALLTTIPAEAQVRLLAEVAGHFDDRDATGLGRFGEPTPSHMLQRFFEGMTEPDRAAVLLSAATRGILSPDSAGALAAGRSTAGRAAPMLTHWADVAARDYANWSEQGSSAAAVAGPFAAAATAETLGDTVVTLGSVGLGAAFAARFPVLASAVAVPVTGGASYQATVDLQAAASGADPYTGRALPGHERLGRILSASSGLMILGSGAALGFRAGRFYPRARVSPREMARMLRDCERIQIDGYPEVWVPKSQLRAPRPAGSPARTPGQLTPGAASAAEAEHAAASLAGSKVQGLMAPHHFGLRGPAVRAALGHEAKRVASAVYLSARAAGKTHKQAIKAASYAVPKALATQTEALAREAAGLEVELRIQDGRSAGRARMTPIARAHINAYLAGRVGREIRALARRLAPSSAAEVRAIMDAEVEAGRATRRDLRIVAPKRQTMIVWETRDGAVVRLKPLGDRQRQGPTVSVEIKMDPTLPDSGPEGIAFKLDPHGRPVPQSMYEADSPWPRGTVQGDAFADAMMDAGHWTRR